MKKYGIFIIMLLLMSTFVVAQAAPGTRVTVNLLSQTPDPVEPGEYVEIRWQIENAGSEGTNDFIFEVMPEYPFSLDPGTPAIQNLGKLGSYQVGEDAFIAYYKLRVDESAIDGSLELKYKYSTNGGKTWTEDSDNIRIEDTNFLVSVESVKTVPESVAPGQNVVASFQIQNLASSSIEDVRIELTLEQVDTTSSSVIRTELPFTTIGMANEMIIDRIKSMETKTIEFPLVVDADAESKIHKIPVTITYNSKQGDTYTKEFKVGIKVFEKPEYLANLENTEVYTNKKGGEVVFSISNTGISKMNFLSVELQPSSDYKILSSKNIYLGNLDSDDFETASYDLYVDTDKEGEIPLNLLVKYKDEYNNEYNEMKSMNLKLYNSNDAVKYGLETPKSKTNTIVSIMVFILLTVFWLFMLIDIIKAKTHGYVKVLWIILILFTYAIGAAIYYIIGRKKNNVGGN